MSIPKRFFLPIIALLILQSCSPQASNFFDEPKNSDTVQDVQPIQNNNIEVKEAKPDVVEEKIIIEEEKEPPVQPTETNFLDNEVVFFSQAPFAYWDELHNEACEEAAMIMVDAFFHDVELTTHLMEQAILDQVSWQTQNFYTYDITANEVAQILKDYFHLDAQVITDVSAESIIRQLDSGKLVIAPAAGQLLGNPYYKTPGPLYHMVVVRGYDKAKKEFITNDPGTKHGQAYRYDFNVLLNAIHDWPRVGATKDDISESQMNLGRKVIIAVEG